MDKNILVKFNHLKWLIQKVTLKSDKITEPEEDAMTKRKWSFIEYLNPLKFSKQI